MGGKSLVYTTTRRYLASEYHAFSKLVVSQLQPIFPSARITRLAAYSSKPDFGDLDLIIDDTSDRDTLLAHAEQLGITEVVQNGPVWSLGWGDFQVDLIFVPPVSFDFARHYFAFNDLGNLIGIVARRLAFKLGQHGLLYPFAEGDEFVEDIVVTRDFDQALHFLGYSSETYHRGFSSLSDIFCYATSSPFFSSEAYLPANRRNRDRVRDNKRPTYTAFLDHLSKRSPKEAPAIVPADHLQRAVETFPDFALRLSDARGKRNDQLQRRRLKQQAKKSLNGKVVSDITGLSGPDLGHFIATLRSERDDIEHWVAHQSPETVRDWIQSTWDRQKRR